MPLTSAQLQTLKADIAANANVSGQPSSAFTNTAINAIPNTGDGNFAIAYWYSQLTNPIFFVYATNIPVQALFDGITWGNLTPVDAPDGTATWTNRSLACQGKQFNLQTLLMGQAVINAAKVNVRAGLQDALTNIPAGTAGALIAAGWVTIRDTILGRTALRIEKLFATTTVQQDGTTSAKSATMVYEGTISGSDVEQARNS